MRSKLLLWLLLLVSPLTFGFTLKWDMPAVSSCDLAEFEVYQSSVSGSYGTTPLARVPATNACGGLTDVSYTGVNPNSGTRYWVVKACDASANCSAPSAEVSYSFLDVTAPGAPTNPRATP
jgi:hypothetical protein